VRLSPFRLPVNTRTLLLVALLLFLPCVSEAHNVGSGLFGHVLAVNLEPGEVNIEYTVEVPASVLIRQYLGVLQSKGLTAGIDKDAYITSRLMGVLHRGLLCIWNGKQIPLEMLDGVQERTGFGSYNFFQYRLTLRGAIPMDQGGTINLINRNFASYQSVYYISLSVSPQYRLKETNLEEAGQRFLIDAQNGRPWSTWEGLRSLKMEIRPAPFWSSLVGKGKPFQLDHKTVYEKTTGSPVPFRKDAAPQEEVPPDSAEGRLKALLMQDESKWRVLPVAVLIAFLLGAVHALGPGHGKALVGAYLVGTRGRPVDAVLLGLLVTFSHVSSVVLLGVASLGASHYFVPEQMLPYLEMISALLLAGLGAWMVKSRWPGKGHAHPHSHAHGHPHGHKGTEKGGHEHPAGGHEHSHHAHQEKQGVRWQEMLSLGISGGMVPCPSALAILLIAVAFQKIALGLVMIVAFSFGLASVLVTVGLVLVWTRSLLKPQGKERAWLSWLPVASGTAILLIGLFMFGRFFLKSGFVQ